MRRRAKRENVGVALFPFLAVLICTMGALIVLLVMNVQQASELHLQASLLTDLANGRLRRSLARFDLTARQAPNTFARPVTTLGQQHLATSENRGTGGGARPQL